MLVSFVATIHNTPNLKEEGAHGFRGFSPYYTGSKVGTTRQNGVVEQSFSVHGAVGQC